MRTIRAVVRLMGVVFFTLVVIITFCLGLIFCISNTIWQIRLKNKLISFWAKTTSRIIGAKMRITGAPPNPPFLLVSNHLSYIDILPFWSSLKTTFIAKNEIRSWPVIGWIARILGIIFITRTKNRDLQRVNEILAEQINAAQGVILFPEGTSTKGEQVLPFKSSLLFFPASQKMPVHYASISYNITEGSPYQAWRDVCWWGGMDFAPHFWKLLHIQSFEINVHFGEEVIRNSDRKALAKDLHTKIEKDFNPTFNP